MFWRPLAGWLLVACCPACVFDLPPLAGGACEGDECAGSGGAGAGGTGVGGSGSTGSGVGGSAGVGVVATPGDEIPEALLITADGDTLVAGTFVGSLEDPTRGALPSRGRDAFLARLGPDGTTRWIVSAGSDGEDAVFGAGALAALPNGDILFGVQLGNATRRLSTPTGDVELPLSSNVDAFVLQLDGAGQYVDLGHVDGQTAPTSVRALLAASAGYWFAGSWGTADDGGYVGRVDGSGNAEVVTIDGGGSESVDALAPLGSGVVAVGTDDIGIFALHLDSGGTPIWVTGVSASARPLVTGAVALDGGRFAIVGTTKGTLSPNGLAPLSPVGDGDGFVIVMSSLGDPVNGVLIGDTTLAPQAQPLPIWGQHIFGAARLGDGLAITGAFVGSLDAGGVKLLAPTDHDAFVILLDAALTSRAGFAVAGPSSQWGAALATRPDGTLAALLGTYGDVEAVGHTLAGGADALVIAAPL